MPKKRNVLINLTGKRLEMPLTKGNPWLLNCANTNIHPSLVLPSIGNAYIERTEKTVSNELYASGEVEVKGLPEPVLNYIYLVNYEVAALLSGYRKDLAYPMVVGETKDTIVCGGIARICVSGY